MYEAKQNKERNSRVIQNQQTKRNTILSHKRLIQGFFPFDEFQKKILDIDNIKRHIIYLKVDELDRDTHINKGFDNFSNRINVLIELKKLLKPHNKSYTDFVENEIKSSTRLLNLGNKEILISDFMDYSNEFDKEVNEYSQYSGRDFNQELVKNSELKRILIIQLANPVVRNMMRLKNIHISIISRSKYMTDINVFNSLKGARTPDGRIWDYVRGNGDTTIGNQHYVAVTEENLLGGNPNLQNADGTNMVGYSQGYSTTTHEVAHSIHRYGLTSQQKRTITFCYNKRKNITDNQYVTTPNDWVDGCYFNIANITHNRKNGQVRQNVQTCYASRNEEEYFAQLTNAYLGTNTGDDPYTNCKRNNGKDWVQRHEPEMYYLLEKLYGNQAVNDVDDQGNLIPNGKVTNP